MSPPTRASEVTHVALLITPRADVLGVPFSSEERANGWLDANPFRRGQYRLVDIRPRKLVGQRWEVVSSGGPSADSTSEWDPLVRPEPTSADAQKEADHLRAYGCPNVRVIRLDRYRREDPSKPSDPTTGDADLPREAEENRDG